MRFLIRSALGLGLLFMLVPIDVEEHPSPKEPVGALHTLAAARAALYDLMGICERRPDVCATARAAFATVAATASESFRRARDAEAGASEAESGHPVPAAPVPAKNGALREE